MEFDDFDIGWNGSIDFNSTHLDLGNVNLGNVDGLKIALKGNQWKVKLKSNNSNQYIWILSLKGIQITFIYNKIQLYNYILRRVI